MVQGIDSQKVTAWFAEHVEGASPPLRFELIVGGHSNLTFKVSDQAGHHYVLRRPPLGAVLKTAHDMGREHKIVSGLQGTAVPVPPVFGYCPDERVNGAPFYVMGFVVGEVLDGPEKAAAAIRDPAARRRLGEHTIDTLAALHTLDPDAVGLGDLGKKEGYLDRQLRRWSIQWEKSKTRELSAMEEAHRLLVAAKPEQLNTGIVHGDYRLGNMLSLPEGRVAAVLDWELCTLGDTLADLGYLLNNWSQPGDETLRGTALGPSAAGGFPSRNELVERYCAHTGVEVAVGSAGIGIDYYCAFQMWRLAAICEGVYARYLQGVMGDQDYDESFLRERVERLARGALRLIGEVSAIPG